MTKAEMVTAYAKKFGITKIAAEREIDHFGDFALEMVTAGETLIFPGFMQIGLRSYEAKVMNNPVVGDNFKVAEGVRPYVKLSSVFKKAVKKTNSNSKG